MDARDELAALIRDSDRDLEAMECLNDHDVEVLVDAILARWRLVPNAQPRHPYVGPMTEGGHWWVDVPLPDGKITICKYCGWYLRNGAFGAVCAGEWLAQADPSPTEEP